MSGSKDDKKRDETLLRMLKTPPKPHKPTTKNKNMKKNQKPSDDNDD